MTKTYYRGKIVLYSGKEEKLLPGHKSGPLRIKIITTSENPNGVFTPGSDDCQGLFYVLSKIEIRIIRVQHPGKSAPIGQSIGKKKRGEICVRHK